MDLDKHFVKYEAVVNMVDQVFDRVKKEFPKRSSAGKNARIAAMPFLI